MPFDPAAEFEHTVPDHVPDDLVSKYGRGARRTVRLSRRPRAPIRTRARRLRVVGRAALNADAWLVALSVFAWSVIGVGALAALVYAVMLLPGAVPILVLPLAVLLVASLGVGVRAARRGAREAELAPF